MSNFVYGFIATDMEARHVKAAVDAVAASQPLGVREIQMGELYGFPEEYLPEDLERAVLFEISDGKGEWGGAEYLVDGIDYAPEADIGLPTRAKDRQELLICLLEAIASLDGVRQVFVTVNDTNQIEEVKVTDPDTFREVALSDFEIASPPDVLYIIDKTQSEVGAPMRRRPTGP